MEGFNAYASGLPVLEVTMFKVHAQFFHRWDQQQVLPAVSRSNPHSDGTSEYYQCLPYLSASTISYQHVQDSSLFVFPARPPTSAQLPDACVISCMSPDCLQITTLPTVGVVDSRSMAGASDNPESEANAFKPVGWVLDPVEMENDRKQNYVLWRTNDIVDASPVPHEPVKNKVLENKDKVTVTRHKTNGRRSTTASKFKETYSKVLQKQPRPRDSRDQCLDVEQKTSMKVKHVEKYNTKIFCNKSSNSRCLKQSSVFNSEGETAKNSDHNLFENLTTLKETDDVGHVSFFKKGTLGFITKRWNTVMANESEPDSAADGTFNSMAEGFVDCEMCSVLMQSLQNITHRKPYSPSLLQVPNISEQVNDPVIEDANNLHYNVVSQSNFSSTNGGY